MTPWLTQPLPGACLPPSKQNTQKGLDGNLDNRLPVVVHYLLRCAKLTSVNFQRQLRMNKGQMWTITPLRPFCLFAEMC